MCPAASLLSKSFGQQLGQQIKICSKTMCSKLQKLRVLKVNPPFAEWQACHGANGIQEVSGSIPLISTKKPSISFGIDGFSILFSLFCAGHFHLGQQMDNRPSQFLLSYCGKEEVMASIKEEGTRGKRLSYKIRVCLGRDENGRQVSKAMR